MALSKTSELDAVNIMLGTIGESPINSLDAATGVVDAVTARSILAEVSVQVQEEGWHFNTEYDFDLTPELTTGYIYVPGNAVEVDTSQYSQEYDVAIRGNRLYDRTNKTFVFAASIKADMTILLEFDEMPQAARHYITIRAARVFQNRVVGSQLLMSYTAQDEANALRALRRFEARTADYNILTSNYSVMRTIDR